MSGVLQRYGVDPRELSQDQLYKLALILQLLQAQEKTGTTSSVNLVFLGRKPSICRKSAIIWTFVCLNTGSTEKDLIALKEVRLQPPPSVTDRQLHAFGLTGALFFSVDAAGKNWQCPPQTSEACHCPRPPRCSSRPFLHFDLSPHQELWLCPFCLSAHPGHRARTESEGPAARWHRRKRGVRVHLHQPKVRTRLYSALWLLDGDKGRHGIFLLQPAELVRRREAAGAAGWQDTPVNQQFHQYQVPASTFVRAGRAGIFLSGSK